MDWNAAIERNRDALTRILAMLVGMAAVTGGGATLPRHLHRAVLRLLRPAEAAARRLVIVAARGLIVALPPQRPRKPKPKSAILRNGVGTGIILPRNAPHSEVRDDPELRACRGVEGEPRRTPAQRTLSLPLTDPLHPLRGLRRSAASGVPRISFPGFCARLPVPVRRPPSPGDPIDAARLVLRLAALGRALDDLPREARRFARWRAARDAAGAQNRGRDAGRVRRLSPLRPGRPPGQRSADSRRPAHEVHDVLNDLQWLAFNALKRPDTS